MSNIGLDFVSNPSPSAPSRMEADDLKLLLFMVQKIAQQRVDGIHETQKPARWRCDAQLDYTLLQLSRQNITDSAGENNGTPQDASSLAAGEEPAWGYWGALREKHLCS